MKNLKYFLFIFCISMASHIHASVFNSDNSPGIFTYGVDSNGDDFTWTAFFENSDGDIGTGLDAFVGDVQITGSDNGLGASGSSGMTTLASVSGTISIDWDYFTRDLFAGYDPFIWLYDDGSGLTSTSITDGTYNSGDFSATGATAQVGTFSADVVAGDLFGFAILSVDNLLGGGCCFADVGLSGFSFTAALAGKPSAVPLPPAFLLFGSALAGLGFMRKKKATE